MRSSRKTLCDLSCVRYFHPLKLLITFAVLDFIVAAGLLAWTLNDIAVLESSKDCTKAQHFLCWFCRQEGSRDECTLYFEALGFSCSLQNFSLILPICSAKILSVLALFWGVVRKHYQHLLAYIGVQFISILITFAFTIYLALLHCYWPISVGLCVVGAWLIYAEFNAFVYYCRISKIRRYTVTWMNF